jgi:hypothetical protein
MIRSRHYLVLAMLFLAACGTSSPALPELPADHPANPVATEASFVPPPNLFKGEGASSQDLKWRAPKPGPSGTPQGAGPTPEEVEKAVEEIMKSYEGIRSLLAEDKPAGQLGLEETRKAFGELSRQLVKLAASVPSLKKDRRIFKCPMWKKGYAKWIQSGPEVSNPYLGKEMPGCGEASEWSD